MADTQSNNFLNQILKGIENLKKELNTNEEKRNEDIKEIKKKYSELKIEINDKIKNIEEQFNKNLCEKKLSKSQDIIRKVKPDNKNESLNSLQFSQSLIQNKSEDNLEGSQEKKIIHKKKLNKRAYKNRQEKKEFQKSIQY